MAKRRNDRDVTNSKTAQQNYEPAKPTTPMPPAVRPKNVDTKISANTPPPRTGVTRPRTKLTGGGVNVPIVTDRVPAKPPAPKRGKDNTASPSKASAKPSGKGSAKASAKPSVNKASGKTMATTGGGKKDMGVPAKSSRTTTRKAGPTAAGTASTGTAKQGKAQPKAAAKTPVKGGSKKKK